MASFKSVANVLWQGTKTTFNHIWQNPFKLAIEGVSCALLIAVLPPLGIIAAMGCAAMHGYQIYSKTKQTLQKSRNQSNDIMSQQRDKDTEPNLLHGKNIGLNMKSESVDINQDTIAPKMGTEQETAGPNIRNRSWIGKTLFGIGIAAAGFTTLVSLPIGLSIGASVSVLAGVTIGAKKAYQAITSKFSHRNQNAEYVNLVPEISEQPKQRTSVQQNKGESSEKQVTNTQPTNAKSNIYPPPQYVNSKINVQQVGK